MAARNNYFESNNWKMLTWVKSHTRLFTYNSAIRYKKGDIITINKMIFQSTVDNNSSNPLTFINWIQLL